MKLSHNGFTLHYSAADKCWWIVSRRSRRIWRRESKMAEANNTMEIIEEFDITADEFDQLEERSEKLNRSRVQSMLRAKRKPR